MTTQAVNAGKLTTIRIGATSLNQTPLDLKGNVARILAAIASARDAGVQVLVLPELCLTGYGCEDAFFRPDLCDKTLDVLVSKIAPASAGMICTVGLPLIYQGALYNAVAVLAGGQISGINAKRRLPRDGVHYEPRWFAPWADGKKVELEVAGRKIPMGDLVYDCQGIRIALEICEEAWGAIPAAASAAGFADLVLNPSASHFSLGKYETREHLVANNSRSFGVYYVYANLVGLEAGRVIYDGGALIACDGKMIARGRRFTFTDHDLVAIDANVEIVRSSKVRKVAFSGQAPGIDGFSQPPALHVVKIHDFPLVPSINASTLPSLSPRQDWSREEEFLLAEVLGLFDYLRKSRAKGFALSLSGGCDSAVCAVLVAEMRRMAIAALGREAFCKRAGLDDDSIEQLLLCVWQATAQSSTETHEAARVVARETGARFVEVDVQPAVDFYLGEAVRISGRKLDWSTDDLALQNIQSRARAPMVWLLANIEGRLLLTTANRSEAATGYSTMDGDSAGGLAPLAGIDKAFLLGWAKWASLHTTPGGPPWQSLQAVLMRPPTAELRPSAAHQTDEADLMPYAVLALIEGCRLRDRLSVPATVDAVLRAAPALTGSMPAGLKIDAAIVRGWVERFERLWGASQWKRERLAAGFHLDDFSVDSRTYCRFPIFSG